MISIGIILVLYKQKYNLNLLYPSLANQTEKNFKIYFVDNNENYDEINYSKEINKKFGLNIEYLKTTENLGFAGGNNEGTRKAIEDGCSYIFFLNNDTELGHDCLIKLRAMLEKTPEIGAASPVIFYWTEGKKNKIIQEYGSNVKFNSYKIIKNYEGNSFDEIKNSLPQILETDLLPGAAMFIRSDVLKKTGLWEEIYFAYGDEIDLARRINNAGFKQVVTSETVVWHNHKWNKDNKEGWYIEYYLTERNKFLYFYKYKLYTNLIVKLAEDIIKFPWRLIWFAKKCDLKLGLFYLLGIFHGILKRHGKPKLKHIN